MMLVIKCDAFSSVGGGVKGGLLVKLWGGVTCTDGCMLMADKCSWSIEGRYLASVDLLLENDASATHRSRSECLLMTGKVRVGQTMGHVIMISASTLSECEFHN